MVVEKKVKYQEHSRIQKRFLNIHLNKNTSLFACP